MINNHMCSGNSCRAIVPDNDKLRVETRTVQTISRIRRPGPDRPPEPTKITRILLKCPDPKPTLPGPYGSGPDLTTGLPGSGEIARIWRIWPKSSAPTRINVDHKKINIIKTKTFAIHTGAHPCALNRPCQHCSI